MYCTNCGNKIEREDKYCPNCGYPVEIIETVEEENNNQINNKKNNRFGAIILLSFVCILLFFTIYKVLSHETEKDISVQAEKEYNENDTLQDKEISNPSYEDSENVAAQDTIVVEEKNELAFNNLKQIASGYVHTIVIGDDGTVYAYGTNTYGRCDVGNWTDIVSVAAGEGHSVGLRSDGTVVATGNNENGQCNVQEWTDIVAIDAYYNHTVGLKKDGTVLATGNNDYGQCDVQDWTDIQQIVCGVYHTIGIRRDGSVVAVGDNESGQCNVQNWTDIIAVSAGWHHTVGIKSDGTLVACGSNEYHQIEIDNIQDAANVVCGEFSTLIQHTDGSYATLGIPEESKLQINNWGKVSQISAKNNHYAAMGENGFIYEAGIGYSSDTPNGREMSSWSIYNETIEEIDEIKSEEEIYEALVEYYKNESVTVMEGAYEDNKSKYVTTVRCGVPGNASASQMLYEIEVDLETGEVTQNNVIVDQITVFNLF